jgi:hypothetical protein
MNQKLTLNIEETQLNFLLHHQNYSFKDEAEMIKFALQKLQSELEDKDLEESPQLYTEIYEKDTGSALVKCGISIMVVPTPRSDRQLSSLCSSIFFATMNQNPIEIGDR